MCKRGDIYYVNFGADASTHKQKGIRPALIISNNKANQYGPVVTVIPLTSKVAKKTHLPIHVEIPNRRGTGLPYSSMALAEQIETVDKAKLKRRLGKISDPAVMERVTTALLIQIGAYAEYN